MMAILSFSWLKTIRKCPAVQQVYWSCLFARGPDPAYNVYNRHAAYFNASAKEHNKTVKGEDRNNLRFMTVDRELVVKYDPKDERLSFTTDHLRGDNVHPNTRHDLYKKVFFKPAKLALANWWKHKHHIVKRRK